MRGEVGRCSPRVASAIRPDSGPSTRSALRWLAKCLPIREAEEVDSRNRRLSRWTDRTTSRPVSLSPAASEELPAWQTTAFLANLNSVYSLKEKFHEYKNIPLPPPPPINHLAYRINIRQSINQSNNL